MLARRREARRQALVQGEILSRLHWQCWREDAPPADVTDAEFISVLPIVIRSGSVGLVWPRLRDRFDPDGAVSLAMEAAFDAQRQHNVTVEREIARCVAALSAGGIKPILVKGWSVARRYPSHLVRPAGDIDLVVRQEEFERADAILTKVAPTPGYDLKHPGIWYENPNTDFIPRLRIIEVATEQVQILSEEDELRLLSFHFLGHGGFRPLWLVDISASLERRSGAYDWDRALSGGQVERGWMVAALGIAKGILGAAICDTPVPKEASRLPAWLIPDVLKSWQPMASVPMRTTAHVKEHPQDIFLVMRSRWPNSLNATINCRAPINSVPRLPIQWFWYLRKLQDHFRHRMTGQLRRLQD